MIESIKNQTKEVVLELIEEANLKAGQILVVGCSSSEICGHKLGSESSPAVGEAVFEAIMEVLKPRGIYLAAQCCEHLNRALVIENAAATNFEIVSVVPKPKAGGSFATAAYKGFDNPVMIEEVKADAGLDIGGTLIGMHLKRVAVPVRLKLNKIGEANILAARVRPKYIGGERAMYC
ncbi:MAG: TIGR01440 family protein [Lachnospiraceae bacterium]|nr:TIGR01440 family protein [Lachnospiraceae bacterium]